jgi:Acetoacetate decarboxylase (ADC)
VADRPELTGVAGVPETELRPDLVDRLPVNEAPAPWSCTCEAVVWLSRGRRAAGAALPPAWGCRALGVLGGFVRYTDTPVGPYDEVLGLVASSTGVRPWGSVAFMAVDSEASLVGGRTNWAMPKTLASFAGGVGRGRTLSAAGNEHRWRVSATPLVVGPPLPVRLAGAARQQFPGARVGTSSLRGRGRVRPALVRVEVESDGPLPTWLRPGRHLGAVVESGSFSLAEPTRT